MDNVEAVVLCGSESMVGLEKLEVAGWLLNNEMATRLTEWLQGSGGKEGLAVTVA